MSEDVESEKISNDAAAKTLFAEVSPQTDQETVRDVELVSGRTKIQSSLGTRGGIVTARGTANGLIVRADGRVGFAALQAAISEFFRTRTSFLDGQEVSLEWIGVCPSPADEAQILSLIENEHGVRIKALGLVQRTASTEDIASKEARAGAWLAAQEERVSQSAVSGAGIGSGLFEGLRNLGGSLVNALSSSDGKSSGAKHGDTSARNSKKTPGVEAYERGLPGDSFLFDSPDARMFYGTLRSGQRVESEHTLIVVGDVNSGAELVSGGDIIVLGTLRGIAHAGAYEESGGGRVIFSLNLCPTQLRIGSIISRGSGDSRANLENKLSQAEIARVESALIVVEPYHSRGASSTGGRTASIASNTRTVSSSNVRGSTNTSTRR